MRIATGLLLVLLLFYKGVSSQAIIINEVQINPAGFTSTQQHREWIEIQNISLKDTTDINGWYLRTDLNDNLSSPIWGDAPIISWDSRYPGTTPKINGSNASTLVTTKTILPPGYFAIILDPTWNSSSLTNISLPDSCIVFTINTLNNFGSSSITIPSDGLLNNSEDIIWLYDGDPSNISSQLIDSVSWKNNTQASGYTLQRDRDCLFKWNKNAPVQSTGGYNADIDSSISSSMSPGVPNYVKATPIIYGDDTICFGDSTHFEINYKKMGCGMYSLKWNFDDPLSGKKNLIQQKFSVAHLYTDTGTYAVSLIIHNGELFDTVYKNIYVAPMPEVNLGKDTLICPYSTSTIVLNAGTGNYNYLWQDSSSSSTYTASTAGLYVVQVSSSAACKVSDSINVDFYAATKLNLGNDTVLCQGIAVIKLDAGKSFANYQWNNGFKGAIFSVNKPGIFSVTVTDINGCKQSDTISIIKNNIAPIDLNPSATMCKGKSLLIDPNGFFASYLWSTGSTDTALTVTKVGTYLLSVKDSNGCSSKDSITITSDPVKAVALGKDSLICKGDTVKLDATNKYTSYLWSTGESSSSIQVSLVGSYSISVKDKFGCSSSDTIKIHNSAVSEVNLGDDKYLCDGDSATLKAGPNYSSYSWSTTEISSSIVVNTATQFSVLVTDSNGCQSSDSILVIINPLPIVSFLFNNICQGDTVHFTNQSAYGFYLWNWGDQSYSSDKNPYHIYDSAGTYNVSLITADQNGCVDSLSQTVTVFPLPSIAIQANPIEGCPPLNVDFSNASTNAISYEWNFGDLSTSTDTNPSHLFSQSGLYDVSLTAISNDGCKADSVYQQLIQVFELPTVNFTFIPNDPDMLSSVIQFTNSASIDVISWQWFFGDGESDSDENPLHMYRDTGTFNISQVVINNNGCSDTTIQQIHIDPVYAFYVPSSFTPNGDGKNDFFVPKGLKIDASTFYMGIYDRWGNLVFTTNDFTNGWNGKINNINAPSEIYTWLFRFNEESGKEHFYRGNVALLR